MYVWVGELELGKKKEKKKKAKRERKGERERGKGRKRVPEKVCLSWRKERQRREGERYFEKNSEPVRNYNEKGKERTRGKG